jgi:hypothetical protein
VADLAPHSRYSLYPIKFDNTKLIGSADIWFPKLDWRRILCSWFNNYRNFRKFFWLRHFHNRGLGNRSFNHVKHINNSVIAIFWRFRRHGHTKHD